MRRRGVAILRGVAAALVMAVAACGDSSGPGADVIPAELAATWIADLGCRPHCGFTLSSVANPADTLNATQMLGLSTEVQVRGNGQFTLTIRPGNDVHQGTARVEGNTLIVTDAAGTVDTITYTVTSTVLDLRFRRTWSIFDFTGDGVPDPATARGVFVKQ